MITPPAELAGPDTDLARFVARVPKAELHLHLEGSIRPATLLEIARRNRVALPATTPDEIERWFEFRGFEHFVEIYLACSRCLRRPEDFALLVRDLAAGQARQNVRYSEVHFTIGTHLMAGLPGDEIADALWQATTEAEHDEGIRLRWIPDIVRNVAWKWADKTVEWLLDHREKGMVALGLSGHESGYPNEPFQAHFAAAAAAGLGRVAHAGEHSGPASVRAVLELLGVDRIGHGVRSSEDPELVAELADRGVPLEVCPTSNVRLGVYPSLEEHPFERLRRAGAAVTVSSDDPPFFGTTLVDEYLELARAFDYDEEIVGELVRAGIRASFLPNGDKGALEAELVEMMNERS